MHNNVRIIYSPCFWFMGAWLFQIIDITLFVPKSPKYTDFLTTFCDILTTFCDIFQLFWANLQLLHNYFYKLKNITKSWKISRQIFFNFLVETNTTIEPQKRRKTVKTYFTNFGTRREHEKIAKTQGYSIQNMGKISKSDYTI